MIGMQRIENIFKPIGFWFHMEPVVDRAENNLIYRIFPRLGQCTNIFRYFLEIAFLNNHNHIYMFNFIFPTQFADKFEITFHLFQLIKATS